MEGSSSNDPFTSEELMKELDSMQQSNPEDFMKLMQAVGAYQQQQNENMAGGVPGGESKSMFDAGVTGSESLQKMAEDILQMRQSAGGPDTDSMAESLKLAKEKQKPGKTITPLPGFTYKTTRPEDEMKVFVNICTHEDIDEPALKKKLNDEGEEVEGLNIPMSVGPMRYDVDKKKEKCAIYDIIVNPLVLEESDGDKTGKYRDFICQLGIQCIGNKYKDILDNRYKLPKLKYMGEVQNQYIQDRKNMPKIEEVSSSSSSKVKKAPASVKPAPVIEVMDKDLPCGLHWVVMATNDMLEENEDEEDDDDRSQERVLERIDWTHPIGGEYIEPTVEVNPTYASILFVADIADFGGVDVKKVAINVSPYRIQIKIPGFKQFSSYLPVAISPMKCKVKWSRPYEGYVSRVELQVEMSLDRGDWVDKPDAGSKAWLMSQALSDDGADSSTVGTNPYQVESALFTRQDESNDMNAPADSADLAEDKFHIKLPGNVDQYTGVALDGGDDEQGRAALEESELPEDRFHKKDASSQYLINQREDGKRDKWEKHYKEKAERETDPNVEYVEMDDFRPGGKYGEKQNLTDKAQEALENLSKEKTGMRKAAGLVQTSLVQAEEEKSAIPCFSSTEWSELL